MAATQLMSVREAADFLQVHPQTVYRLVRERKIASVRVGKGIRFRRSDLDRFVEENLRLEQARTGCTTGAPDA